MISTRNEKVEFGRKAESREVKVACSTQGHVVKKTETIRIVHQNDQGEISSGYRKVNFSEQKRREVYRKINKMLGGN